MSGLLWSSVTDSCTKIEMNELTEELYIYFILTWLLLSWSCSLSVALLSRKGRTESVKLSLACLNRVSIQY